MKDYFTATPDPLDSPSIRNYYEVNLALARTVVFKMTVAAETLNQSQIEYYADGNPLVINLDGTAWDETDPVTWKYYVNLAGNYHMTDQSMYVVSLDTQQEILFSKENLALHPKTKEAYRLGAKYQRLLVNKYPDQEDVIMGMLFPIPSIQDAIDAEDGTILRWDASLVEPQEYSLIKDLESWIKNQISRWYVDAYKQSDSYWLTFFHHLVYTGLLPKLLNLRDSRRQTYEVHSFHIKSFLAGYMGLDQYYKHMTLKQALYLYRNLPRLAYYVGHTNQFVELIENILTDRSIPVSAYNVRHYDRLANPKTYFGNYKKDFSPVPTIQTEKLNSFVNYGETSLVTLEDAFTREMGVLYGTPDYYAAEEQEVVFAIRNNDGEKALTKDLVSQTIDYEGTLESEIRNITLSHWGYLSGNDLYNVPVTFKVPETGITYTMTTDVIFTYLYYLTLSYMGFSKTEIAGWLPYWRCEKMSRKIDDMVAFKVELYNLLPLSYRPPGVDELQSDKNKLFETIITDLIARYVVTQDNILQSTEDFYNICNFVNEFQIYQRQLASTFQFHPDRGYIRLISSRFYLDQIVELITTPSGYVADAGFTNAWLYEQALPSYEEILATQVQASSTQSPEEASQLYLASFVSILYREGTNSIGLVEPVDPDVHRAMINIMRALTSYNIQWIDIQSRPDYIPIYSGPTLIYGDTPSPPGDPTGRLQITAFIPAGIDFLDIDKGPADGLLNVGDAILVDDGLNLNVGDAILMDEGPYLNVGDAELVDEP